MNENFMEFKLKALSEAERASKSLISNMRLQLLRFGKRSQGFLDSPRTDSDKGSKRNFFFSYFNVYLTQSSLENLLNTFITIISYLEVKT